MRRGDDAWWRADIDLAPGDRYGFLLDDDATPLPDPRGRRLPDGIHGPSAVVDPAVFADAGDRQEAERIRPHAAAMRKAIMSAVERSIRRDLSPPFVPVALFGEEQPYHPITGTKMGSYYNLMAPYVLGSGVFPAKSAAADALNLTADRLNKLGLLDEVIEEPLGGAHRDAATIAERVKAAVLRHLDELEAIPREELKMARAKRLASFGVFSESAP